MPQINRGFSLSKMNKDFDERIVKEGEYRDALNVQVQASEDSDVGSAQSILGNVLMSSGMVPRNSRCVGAITDDKEDKIYYLVAGPQYDPTVDQFTTDSWKDYIIEYDLKTQVFKYVFVDIYRTHFETSVLTTVNLWVNSPNNPPLSNARPGMVINGYYNGLHIIVSDNSETVEIINASEIFNSGYAAFTPQIEISSDSLVNGLAGGMVPGGTILQCTQKRVLNFSWLDSNNKTSHLITGINIIDGMLFWTDNYFEPKKINIERSIGGTGGIYELPLVLGTVFDGDNADWHTRLCITPDKHHSLRVLRRLSPPGSIVRELTEYAEEENITVIKKGPRTPPRLVMSQHEDDRDGDTFSPTSTGIIGNPDFLAFPTDTNCFVKITGGLPNAPRPVKEVGDPIGDIMLDNPVDWKEGDMILFNQQDDVNSAEGFTEHDVRATVVAPLPPGMPGTTSLGPWHMIIQAIDEDAIDEEQKLWNLRLEEKKPLFEFKFVRFAYRYKYEDGEYSTFSPWSEPAFLPGEYDYLPKKGYNLGMTNRLRQLKITNYITERSEKPKDIIEVDLLYKDESSPNIYTVETIRRTDGWTVKGELLWPDTLNGPIFGANVDARGEYNVTSELIHKTVPSNQLLRQWDNVPKKALAQSISANRLVYGNYVQNFNLKSITCGETEIKPEINVSLRAVDAPLNAPVGLDANGDPISNAPLNGLDNLAGFATPGKTARSLRTYQVGVVYGDEYGRETPVLAGHNGTGSLTILKENSSTLNKLEVNISTPAPDFAYYYKMFIKETSNEYYNLAMDRWYEAEDGNIWLSFASADRNKVDIETSLILKKKHDSHEPVTDPARYKILAIENSAPDFIKTNIKSLGVLSNSAGGNHIGTTSTGFPAPDNDKLWFTANITGLNDLFDQVVDAKTNMLAMRNKGTLYFRVRTTTIRSDWYQVAGYTTDNSWHKIKSDKPFGDDMDFTSIGGDISSVITGLQIELAEFSVENKKEFEGRFFVKIFKNLVLKNNLLTAIAPEYRVRMAKPIGYWNIPFKGTENSAGWACAAYTTADWEAVGTNLKGEFDSNTSRNSQRNWCNPNAGGGPQNHELFFHGAWGSTVYGEIHPFCSTNQGCARRNVTKWAQASMGRFHIDNMWTRGDRNGTCGSGGGTCVGCNSRECAASCKMGRGINNGGVPNIDGLSMDIGYITNDDGNKWPYHWGNDADEDFFKLLTTAGTNFRWREDPDELVYTVTGAIANLLSGDDDYGMQHVYHDVTNGNLGNNKFRFRVSFERVDQPGVGFGQGDAGYHPIGGKDVTKVAGRQELGWWGGHQSTLTTSYATNTGTFGAVDIPTPPGYTQVKFPVGTGASTIYDSVVDYQSNIQPGELGFIGFNQVTKSQMGCRWRQHTSKFHHIEIVEPIEDDDADWSSENPAIWETEPKEDVGIDIYYEASPALPIEIDNKTNEMFAPYGSVVVDQHGKSGYCNPIPGVACYPIDNYVLSWSGNSVTFTFPIEVGNHGSRIGFMRPDGLITYAIINEGTNPGAPIDATNFGVPSDTFTVRWRNQCPNVVNSHSDAPHNQPLDLSWYNAFAFGNGIESDRMRDDYNQITLTNGVKASSVMATQYEEERRKTGLIHSGLYNSTSGINDLNQFIAAEKITKDMNPEYGSIQKLYTRDGDIVVMHEDKIMKVMADKDALYNADGKSNVALSSNFLGSDRPFATKYGISTNPESFAVDGNGRIYFADRARSAVLRLSGDGITNISDYGMKDWFNDHLNPHTGIIIGSYDAKKSLYNISIEGYLAPETLEHIGPIGPTENGCGCATVTSDNPGDPATSGLPTGEPEVSYENAYVLSDQTPPNLIGYTFFQETLSFSEQSKGWVSFKSFFPECGLSINNEYYTWHRGDMYKHHANSFRNNFYGIQYKSTIDILFNDTPEVVKSFTALNYEGSLARITPHVAPFNPVIGNADDSEYFNLTGKDGWYVDKSTTDLQTTGQLEFKNKEGKYFSYVKGVTTTLQNLDEQEFSVQGIGVLGDTAWADPGDPYNPPEVVELVDYCLEITPLANCGEILGCTDPLAINYDPSATVDDGSCIYDVYGCMDPYALNYNENCAGVVVVATKDDGCCLYPTNYYGCMNPAALNFDPLATLDCDNANPASSVAVYVNGVATQGCICGQTGAGCCCCYRDGCMDPAALNYDAAACCDDGNCIYPTCVYGCTDPYALNYDNSATCDCDAAGTGPGNNDCCTYCVYGCTDPLASNYDNLATCDCDLDGSGPGNNECCTYANVYGCTDITACNYDALANVDDGSCCLIEGCMDALAVNYDPTACCDDGSCCYTAANAGCVCGNLGWCNGVNLGWGYCMAQLSLSITNPSISGASDGSFQVCFDSSAVGAGWIGPIITDSSGVVLPGSSSTMCGATPTGTQMCICTTGLVADTYDVWIQSGSWPCIFQTTITLTEPSLPLVCANPSWPNPSYQMHDANTGAEDWDSLFSPLNYGTYNSFNHDYAAGTHEARMMGTYPAFGWGTTDLHTQGFFVKDTSDDYVVPQEYYLQIEVNSDLPAELVDALDTQWPDSSGNLGNLAILGTYTSTPTLCGSGGGSVNHLNMWQHTTGGGGTEWISEKYSTWGEFLDALNDLTDSLGNPLFAAYGTFDITTHHFLDVRYLISHWAGTCSTQVPEMFRCPHGKCTVL